jgi:RNA polymerase sigma-70 factor, ECF subfamily
MAALDSPYAYTPPLAPPPKPLDAGKAYREWAGFVAVSLRGFRVPWTHIPDLRQDVFLLVHRLRDRYDPTQDLKGWLYGICRHVANDHRKSAYNRRTVLADDIAETHAHPPDLSPERIAGARERLDQVQTALARLRDEDRVVLELSLLDGLPPDAIGAQLGLTVDLVHLRIHRARKALDNVLDVPDRRRRTMLLLLLLAVAVVAAVLVARVLEAPFPRLVPADPVAPSAQSPSPTAAPKPRLPGLCGTTCPGDPPPHP